MIVAGTRRSFQLVNAFEIATLKKEYKREKKAVALFFFFFFLLPPQNLFLFQNLVTSTIVCCPHEFIPLVYCGRKTVEH